MKESNDLASRLGRNGASSFVVVAAVVGVSLGIQGGQSFGVKPTEPLAPPFYSFDKDSPTVGPDPAVGANDVLMLGPPPPPPDPPGTPTVLVTGQALGLDAPDDPDDEIDALSANNGELNAEDDFVLLFSVTRTTFGEPQNDADRRFLGVPFHVFNQNFLGHGPGDQFMRIRPPGGSAADRGKAGLTRDNCLLRNQYDEGGSDFGGVPETTAWQPNPALPRGGRADPLNRDDVNSMMMTNRSAEGILEVYFSLSKTSPSLPPAASLDPSGADIFYNPDPNGSGGTVLYASAAELDLAPDDDIDGMIIFDHDWEEGFNAGDEVLFSLTPDSPTLWGTDGKAGVADVDDNEDEVIDDSGETGWEGSDDFSPADVFLVQSGGSWSVLVDGAAADLGLLTTDNVDALDYFICDKPNDVACAKKYGIRWSPIPAVSEWGLLVMALLGLVAGTIMFRARPRREPQQ